MALLTLSAKALAQVGLSSPVQSVMLVVRVPEHASFEQLGSFRESPGREGSVRVRLSGSSGYRLVVRGLGPEASRLSVRAEDGSFHRLVGQSPVTVARHPGGHGELDYDVQYRAEDLGVTALPVRYELVVDPVL